MKTVNDPKKMTAASRNERAQGRTIGVVPTLGYLHDGHEALVKIARKDNDIVIVTRFVNPLQFRAKAFRDYPRDAKRDAGVCSRLGADYLFSPETHDMYPNGFDTGVEVKELAGRMEGSSIRWHYRGVATVVAKLFNITQPDRAYFGKKDPHQLAILKRMTEDLNFPVKIVPVATRRGRDGVALSSRNSLLTPEEREAVKAIPKAIKAIESRVALGKGKRKKLTGELIALIEKEPLAKVDFAAVVDADTLQDGVYGKNTLIYAAVYIGGKRLTDNTVVKNRSR